MRNFLAAIVLLITGLHGVAQPIYRRGGFQFAFQSDSALTSDYFYANPKEGKKFAFAVPAQMQAVALVNLKGITNAEQVSLFPTLGFKSGKWRGEAYVGVTHEKDQLDYGINSSGFGQKPAVLDSSPARSFVTPGFVIQYNASKYFNFAAGYDKNFIGEGYYSLFLSDNAANTPFVRSTVKFWKVKYSLLLNHLDNNNSYRTPDQLKTNKYSATHVISFNPTKWAEFVLFESIIWQSRDSLYARGFDVNYLNPVAFFRPIEYQLGSPDNAMLGIGLNLRFAKNFTMYGQIMLDEFLLRELKAGKGWWANKFGLQGGMKWFNAFNVKGLNLLGEANLVKPYTYSHLSNNLNYGSHYAALAHPWGSNFVQLLFVGQYFDGLHRFVLTGEVGRKGLDKAPQASYGGNIFVPYKYRVQEYGNKLAQGQATDIINGSIQYGYTFSQAIKLEAFASMGLRKFGPADFIEFKIGVRTPFFNSYANY